MTGQRILLVDDEPQLIRALKPALIAEGYEVEVAASGQTAMNFVATHGCDVVVLDLGLPDMDGKAVIAKLRAWSDTPVIVLSARNVESEKIAALDIGADDFVNKPFDVGELMARLRVALRGRERRFAARDQFSAGGLEVNFADRRVFVDGAELRLTPREFELLQILARHAGRPVTHMQINAAVRGPGASADPQFVRVLVGQLRHKLESDPSQPRFVLTEPGFGYRLIAED